MKIKATMRFETGQASYMHKHLKTITRTFNGRKHLDNYIAKVMRDNGWFLDELWTSRLKLNN
jgi:hypothetical protein